MIPALRPAAAHLQLDQRHFAERPILRFENSASNGRLRCNAKNGADLGVSVSASPSTVFVELTAHLHHSGRHNSGPTPRPHPHLRTRFRPDSLTVRSPPLRHLYLLGHHHGNLRARRHRSRGRRNRHDHGHQLGYVRSLTNSPALSGHHSRRSEFQQRLRHCHHSRSAACLRYPGNDGAAPINGHREHLLSASCDGTLVAGATQIRLGRLPPAAPTVITKGDLLLVIQMQAATINTAIRFLRRWSDGDPAYGSTALNGVGDYEFVTAASTLKTKAGGTLTIAGAGVNGGLLYSYFNNVATSHSRALRPIRSCACLSTPRRRSIPIWRLSPGRGAVGGISRSTCRINLTLGGDGRAR